MACEFRYPMRVEFAEVDEGGITHFSNYFRYMERAEHAFFRALGVSTQLRVEDHVIGWPRVHAECTWKVPLRFEDEFEVHLVVRKKSKRLITYDFSFYRQEERIARGSFKVVCVKFDMVTRTLKSTSIPPEIDERVEAAPKETRE